VEGNRPMHSVLVIDDDESLRTLLRQWVDAAGFRAREADSAEEALLAMEREVADIALCDVKMGGRDGVWLASEIRRVYPHTAIVMATVQNDIDTVAASLRNDVVTTYSSHSIVDGWPRPWPWRATGIQHRAASTRFRANCRIGSGRDARQSRPNCRGRSRAKPPHWTP